MPQTAVDTPPGSASRQRTLVVVAGDWGASFGGINAFNLDFCLALGQLLRGIARFICITAPVDEGPRKEAAAQGVEIVSLPLFNADDAAGTAQAALSALQEAGVGRPDFIIGHDVKTGPVAEQLRALTGGNLAVIHHMSYGRYHSVKAAGVATRYKEQEQERLLRSADVVLAVGPLLRDSALDLCQGTCPVTMIVPGLAEIEPIVHRERQFRAIAFGRMGKEDDRIKQGRLAAAGYGRFVHKTVGLDLGYQYRFNIYGLSEQKYAAEEAAVKELVNRQADGLVNVVACPYTTDRQELFAALAANEVAMMLSWHEGFGLVGWEAIAARVPLLVSEATGLYQLLRDEPGVFGSDCVIPIEVRGTDADHPHESDIEAVSAALFKIGLNRDRALDRAGKLRDYLGATYTWETCARAAIGAFGWEHFIPAKTLGGPQHPPHPTGDAAIGRLRDVERLRNHTRATHARQADLAVIGVGSARVKITRPSTAALVSASQASSLLLVGEPGAGKSGAEYDLVEDFLRHGKDVVLLVVDQLTAESLGELRIELGLENPFMEVLRSWPGSDPGYVVIDALDAARSHASVRTLRELIARVLGDEGRWRVIASIRKYDLRYSQELKTLFSGDPPTTYIDREFERVRHLNIPLLDDNELRQIASQAPALDTLIGAAGMILQDLLRVPFNLRLAAELLGEGVAVEQLTPLRTQLELLDRYWQTRVIRDDGQGDSRELMLRRGVEEMVRRRSMQADRSAVMADCSSGEALESLLSANVLLEWQPSLAVRPDRYVLSFSHHVLYDYAVARLLLRGTPTRVLELLEREPELAVAIRPSLTLHFQHLWALDNAHTIFWDVAVRLQSAEHIPEVAKVIPPSVAAELATIHGDYVPILECLGGVS